MTIDDVREIIADYKHNLAYYADYAPDLYQTRADVDCEPDTYPGWTSMQSAAREAW